jgi:hypothetical protein
VPVLYGRILVGDFWIASFVERLLQHRHHLSRVPVHRAGHEDVGDGIWGVHPSGGGLDQEVSRPKIDGEGWGGGGEVVVDGPLLPRYVPLVRPVSSRFNRRK